MMHSIRWTLPKIERYLKVIDHLVYRRSRTHRAFSLSHAYGSRGASADWKGSR